MTTNFLWWNYFSLAEEFMKVNFKKKKKKPPAKPDKRPTSTGGY